MQMHTKVDVVLHQHEEIWLIRCEPVELTHAQLGI